MPKFFYKAFAHIISNSGAMVAATAATSERSANVNCVTIAVHGIYAYRCYKWHLIVIICIIIYIYLLFIIPLSAASFSTINLHILPPSLSLFPYQSVFSFFSFFFEQKPRHATHQHVVDMPLLLRWLLYIAECIEIMIHSPKYSVNSEQSANPVPDNVIFTSICSNFRHKLVTHSTFKVALYKLIIITIILFYLHDICIWA